jgi:hypothetical protein
MATIRGKHGNQHVGIGFWEFASFFTHALSSQANMRGPAAE